MTKVCLKTWMAAALVTGMLLPARGMLQAQEPPTEYQVKAAFLYNFAKFIEWPPEVLTRAGNSLTLCVWGEDPFGRELEEALNGKTIQDKKLVFQPLASLKEASRCQIVFISASEQDHLETILSRLEGIPLLTVSDMSRFIQNGGAVGFSTEDNRVRFGVNLTAAGNAKLKISSQLLKLAQTVKGTSTEVIHP